MSGETSTPELPSAFAALLERPTRRADVLQGLKTLIAAGQAGIRQAHYAGAPGREVVRQLTALADAAVRTAFRYAQAQHPGDTAPCALVAFRGYGRGELHPYSDLHVLFLCQKTMPRHVIRNTLYLLWDLGYTLDCRVCTRREAVCEAERNPAVRTEMLDMRLLDGDPALFASLHAEVAQRRLPPRRLRAFVQHQIAACRQRHTAFANTVQVMESHVKEGPGGLRDYHTARWLGMACYQANTLAALGAHGLVSPGDQEAVEAAVDFLFRVRNALHYRHGRSNDSLSVKNREPLAAALGFHASTPECAVASLLTTYDRHAKVLLHLCRTVMEAVSHIGQPGL